VHLEQDKPVALFPFVYQKSYLFRIIKFIAQDTSDYCTPLYCQKTFYKPDQLISIFDQICKVLPFYDLIDLGKIPSKLKNVDNIFIGKKFTKYTTALRNNSLLRYEFNKKDYHEVKRSINKLEKEGNLNVIDCSLADNPLKYFTKLSEFKKNFCERNFRSFLKINFIISFYKSLYFQKCLSNHINFIALEFNQKPIALHFGFKEEDYFYYLAPAYDYENFRKSAPGKILLYHLIDDAKQNNIMVFDFLLGDESYKAQYTNDRVELLNYRNTKTVLGFIFLNVLNTLLYLKNKISENFNKLKH
jgi:CelD/BcsL family acetyltransferase involved in cellulose biosynthesis